MKNIFKQLIIDFHKRKLPQPSFRDIELPELPKRVKKAFVFIGMRRSGKTWLMYQEIQRLMAQGVDREKIVYINFEDDRLGDMTDKDLHLILESFYELYPKHVKSEDLYFFFDEIHEVSGWEKFIRRILDSEPVQVYLSGSSAKMLSKEIATNLRGRTITREVFPFNFREYLISKQFDLTDTYSSKEIATLSSFVQQFIVSGGFPETIHAAPALHRELLQGYVDSVIYRDIIDRYHIANTASLKRLITDCLQNSSKLFSVNKTFKTLKSLGYSVSKNTLYQFMAYLEDAYCIFSVDPFDPSFRKSSQKPKKIYPVDQGLITAYGWNENFSHGTRLEAAIFSQLKRLPGRCFYIHTSDGKEVDFVYVSPANDIKLIQVTLTMREGETREREVNSLRSAMREFGIEHGIIVTLNDKNDVISVDEDRIKVIPSWDFLLNVNEFL